MELRRALPSVQIRILMLRRFADPLTGEFETTTEVICRMTRSSRSAVQKALRSLERARLLHVQYARHRTVRLLLWFGGFPASPYRDHGKPPLLWDVGSANGNTPSATRECRVECGKWHPACRVMAPGPKNPGTGGTKLLLKLVHAYLLAALDRRRVHLRLNILLPTGHDRLKVVHGHNMDNDRDRGLELGLGSGAAGQCWETRQPVVCDLADARDSFATKWRMTEEQQALVRPTLRSLLSVPILASEAIPASHQGSSVPLGILSFDSDEDLRREFNTQRVQEAAAETAAVAGIWLNTDTRGGS